MMTCLEIVMRVIKMVELPLYHMFSIFQKVQKGQDITYDDLARLYGTPTYQVIKMLDRNLNPSSLSQVYSKGQRSIDISPVSSRYHLETSNQAYQRHSEFGYKRKRLRGKYSRFNRRRYKSRSLRRFSAIRKRRFSPGFQYSSYY